MDAFRKEFTCIYVIMGRCKEHIPFDKSTLQHCFKKIRWGTFDPVILAKVDKIESAHELYIAVDREYGMLWYVNGPRKVEALKVLAEKLAPVELHWHPGIKKLREEILYRIMVYSRVLLPRLPSPVRHKGILRGDESAR